MDVSSSSADLASDWAVVSSVSENSGTENGAANVDEESTENKIKVDEDDKTTHVKHVGSQVDDVLEDCDSYSQESNSSSDIDVIDESALDDSPLKTETFLPPPILTISSSTETTTTSPETPEVENVNDAEGHENQNQAHSSFWTFAQRAADFIEHCVVNYWNREDRNRNVGLEFGYIGLFLVITILATTTVRNIPPIKMDKDSSIRLEELEKVLKLENKNLMLEMENDKAFAALEEQMKEIKNENLKLQEYIAALQKQSNAENKERGTQNFYKKEINELKEQVNILKFDNEELQKQLVRMRYGSYLSSKSDEGKNKENKERQENISNEFRELKKDLHAEVSRLQKLNELIDILTRELHKSSEKKDSSSEKEFEKEKPNKKEESSDWSWKDVKQNIKDAVNNFHKINISGLFTKYVKNKKMHLEDAFKNIGHYFKSAQKDIESHFPEDLKEQWKYDIKSTLEALGGKWAKIKNEYFRMNKNSEDSATDVKNNEPEFSNTFQEPAAKQSNRREHDKFKVKTNFLKKQENVNEDESENSEAHSGRKRSWNTEEDLKNYETAESESWLFERAAERAKHRVIEEEPSVNWYLRNNKDEMHEDDLFETTNDKSH